MAMGNASWSQDKPRLDRRLIAILVGVLVAAVFVVYGASLAQGIVFNDELTFLLLTGLQTKSVSADLLLRPLFQPWVRLSYLQDMSNYGATFGWYHLVNVWFHLVSVVALFALVFRVSWRFRNEGRFAGDPYRLAFAAAILFATHPLATQAATYLSARYAGLGACNYLLSANALVLGVAATSGGARFWGYLLCVAFGWMSLCSFEPAACLPLFLLCLFFLIKPEEETPMDWATGRPLISGILIALSVAIPGALILGFQPAAVPNQYGFGLLSPVSYIATQAKSLLTYYLRCSLVPIGLSIDPPYTLATTFADAFAIVGGAVFLSVVGFWFHALKSDRMILALGATLFLLGLFPHFVHPQQELVADPTFYLSLSGLCVIAAGFLEPFLRQTWVKTAERLAPAAIVLAGLAITYSLDFKNDETLARKTLQSNPSSAIAHTLNANDLFSEKKYEESVKEADAALATNPASAMALMAKGAALTKLGQADAAGEVLTKAVALAKDQRLITLPMVQYALAENLVKRHQAAQADEVLKVAMIKDPHNPRALYVLGLVEHEKKNYQGAAMYLSQGLRKGVFDCLTPLGDCALRLKKFDSALEIGQKAVGAGDDRGNVIVANAAYALQQNGVASQAIEAAAQKYPDDPTVLALRSLICERKGQVNLAREYRESALHRNADAFATVVMPETAAEKADAAKKQPVKQGAM